jgi:hypothetical protein
MPVKIKNKVLSTFLKKIGFSGIQTIKELLLDFSDNGLSINVNSQTQQSKVVALLKSGAFVEYSPMGKIGINDLPTLLTVLKRFGDEIKITKEGNLLTIAEDKKKVDIELVDPRYLEEGIKPMPQIAFTDSFKMAAADIKGVFEDITINKDAVLTIETKPKLVIFKNTGKYKFNREVTADGCNGGVLVNFGEPLMDVITNLDSEIEISIKSDYPAKVIETTDVSNITIIVAPRTEQ